MTEKRFVLKDIGFVYDNGELIGMKELVDQLNELSEEKEYYQIKSGKCEEELLKLRRENEQLNAKVIELRMTKNKRFMLDDAGELIDLNNHQFIDYGDECCNLLNELNDENELLKKEIEQLK